MGFQPFQLKTASLATLIALAQSSDADDTAAMNEIIARFERLTQSIAGRLTSTCLRHREDIANACRLGLVRAVRRHDRARDGFPAYAHRFMLGAGLRELKQLISGDRGSSGIDDEALQVPGSEDVHKDVSDRLALWGDGPVADAVSTLSPQQQEIAALRYVHDAPLEQIAAKAGTSVSAVSQRLSTIHRKIELELAA
jgi:RNA polymerase sigma factor (sigma-70 family)